MCMSGGCGGGKKTSGGSYSPKKANFPKPIGAKKQSFSSRGIAGNRNQFGSPQVRMSFGRKS